MPTSSADIENRIQLAIEAVREGTCTTWKAAAKHFYLDYDLLLQRSHRRPTNYSRGGQNKKLLEKENRSLRQYYERCILTGDPPKRKHIQAATNSICRAVGKKPVTKT
jgi:hypothetical protein